MNKNMPLNITIGMSRSRYGSKAKTFDTFFIIVGIKLNSRGLVYIYNITDIP